MDQSIIENEPIGAVVKKADDVFTQVVRKTSNGNFNRTEWQFLNFLHEKSYASKKEIVNFLKFFESHENINATIKRFENDALVTIAAEDITITHKGKEAFRQALQVQEKIKENALHGITKSDYTNTIATIKKIIENLTEYLPENAGTDITNRTQVFDGRTEDLIQIKGLVERMEQAHNQKDAELLASLFEDDAVFVNAAGVRLHGREDIYKSAIRVMGSFMAKSYAKYQIAGIRFLKEDIAVVDINQQPTTNTGELLLDETAGIPTYVVVKDAGGDWKIVTGQNTLVIKNYP
jgi:uncharacterized protein (TIGR02246 family)